jgi:hypothetical protein
MMIRRATPERLTELARGIARDQYLIVDDSPEWVLSLSMMGDSLLAARNLGMVLVPVGPHLGGYWINGEVPGVTISCVVVAKGDVRELTKRVKQMLAALYPDP